MDFFKPSVSPDRHKTRQVRYLYIVLWILLSITAVSILVTIFTINQAQTIHAILLTFLAFSLGGVSITLFIIIRTLKKSLRLAQKTESALINSINMTTSSIASVMDLDMVLDTILISLKNVIAYDSVSIFLVEDNNKLHVKAGKGFKNNDEIVGLYFDSESGVFDEIAKSKRPLVLADAQQDPRFAKWANLTYIHGWMGVPLLNHDKLIGFLNIDNRQIGAYGPEEAELAQTFANQATIAILNAQLFMKLQDTLQKQTALQQASELISSSIALDSVLKIITEQICRITDGTSTYICSYQPHVDTTTILAEYISEHATPREKNSDLGITYSIEKDFPILIDIAQSHQPQIVYADKPNTDAGMQKHLVEYGAYTSLILPLEIRGEIIAFCAIWESRYVREYTPDEITLCKTIAQQAAIAIENARLFSNERQQREQAETLKEISSLVASSLNLQEILQVIIQQLLNYLQVSSCIIRLYEPPDKLVWFLSVGIQKELSLTQSTTVGKGLTGKVAKELQPYAVKDVQGLTPYPTIVKKHGLKSFLGVPMLVKDELIGVLSVYTQETRDFTQEEIKFLLSLAEQAAIAIENTRLFERVQNEATILEKEVSHRTQQLQEINHQLEQEIQERKETERLLQAYTIDLEKSNRQLQDFAYVASHDLQEPLRKIQAFSDRLLNRYQEKLDDRGILYLERMHAAASRMQTLVVDLLAYSSVTTERKSFTAVDLNKVLNDVTSALESQIEREQGTVNIPTLPTINGDKTQLHQLFQNLISNALKFHKPDVAPMINLHVDHLPENEQDTVGPTVQITVQDNGIGFDQKYADRLFEMFQRLESRDDFEGTGMGLAICQKIVERHQGTITAKGEEGVGASFIVILPLQAQEKERSENVKFLK